MTDAATANREVTLLELLDRVAKAGISPRTEIDEREVGLTRQRFAGETGVDALEEPGGRRLGLRSEIGHDLLVGDVLGHLEHEAVPRLLAHVLEPDQSATGRDSGLGHLDRVAADPHQQLEVAEDRQVRAGGVRHGLLVLGRYAGGAG